MKTNLETNTEVSEKWLLKQITRDSKELENEKESFITEAGDVEKWDGNGKAQLLKYKEEALEYLKKQKKE